MYRNAQKNLKLQSDTFQRDYMCAYFCALPSDSACSYFIQICVPYKFIFGLVNFCISVLKAVLYIALQTDPRLKLAFA